MEYTFNIKYDKCIHNNMKFNIEGNFLHPLCFSLEIGKYMVSLDKSYLFINKANGINKYYKSINTKHKSNIDFYNNAIKVVNNPDDYILTIKDTSIYVYTNRIVRSHDSILTMFSQGTKNKMIVNEYLGLKNRFSKTININKNISLKELYSNSIHLNRNISLFKSQHSSTTNERILLKEYYANSINIDHQMFLGNNIANSLRFNNNIVVKELYANKININIAKMLTKSSQSLSIYDNIKVNKRDSYLKLNGELLIKNKYAQYKADINKDFSITILNKRLDKNIFHISLQSNIRQIYTTSNIEFKHRDYNINKLDFKLLTRDKNALNKNAEKLLKRSVGNLTKDEYSKSLFKSKDQLSKNKSLDFSISHRNLFQKDTYSLADIINKKLFTISNEQTNTKNRELYKIETFFASGGFDKYLTMNTIDLFKNSNNLINKLEYQKRAIISANDLIHFENISLKNDDYMVNYDDSFIIINTVNRKILKELYNISFDLSGYSIDKLNTISAIKLDNNMFKYDMLNVNKASTNTSFYNNNIRLLKPKPQIHFNKYMLYLDKPINEISFSDTIHISDSSRKAYKDYFYIFFDRAVSTDIFAEITTKMHDYKKTVMNEYIRMKDLYSNRININNDIQLKYALPKYAYTNEGIYTKLYSKKVYPVFEDTSFPVNKYSKPISNIDTIFFINKNGVAVNTDNYISLYKDSNKISISDLINLNKSKNKSTVSYIFNINKNSVGVNYIYDIVNFKKSGVGVFDVDNIVNFKKSGVGIFSLNTDIMFQKDGHGIYMVDIVGFKKDSLPIDIINMIGLKRDSYKIRTDKNIFVSKDMKYGFFQYENIWIDKDRHDASLIDEYMQIRKNRKDTYSTDEVYLFDKNIKDTHMLDDYIFFDKSMHHSFMQYENLFGNKLANSTQINNDLSISRQSMGIFEDAYILNVSKNSQGIMSFINNDFTSNHEKPTLADKFLFAECDSKPIYITDTYMPIIESKHQITINKYIDDATLKQKVMSNLDNNGMFINGYMFNAEFNSLLNLTRDIRDSHMDYENMWSYKNKKDSSIYDNISMEKYIKDTNLFNVGEMVDLHHFGPSKPNNADTGIIDELILPHKDYKYSDMIDNLLQPDGTINVQYIKKYDTETGEYTVTLPVENPIGMYADVGRDYLDIDVSVLDMVTFAAVDIWKTNMFRYISMSAQDALRDIMVKLHEHIINIVLDGDRYRESIRCLQLFRWYAEMAILNNCEYVLKFDTQKIAIDYYNKSLGALADFITFENMGISDQYILEPIDVSKTCTMTIRNNSPVNNYKLNLSFTLYNINTSSSISIIEDEKTKAKKYEPGIHDINIEFKDKVVLRFIPTGKYQSINVANVSINNITMRGFTATYKGMFGETNKVMQDLLDRLLVIGEVSSDMKDTLKDVAPVTVAIDTMMKYFELHHENKLKGKRLITKK